MTNKMIDAPVLALILAAGEGKRMNSALPKVLQPLGGQPMIYRILQTLSAVKYIQPAIIYGHQGAVLQEFVRKDYPNMLWVEQRERLGTGHAVQQAQHLFQGQLVLVLLGDVPLISSETIIKLCCRAKESGFALLTTVVSEPYGYGRILRDDCGEVVRIVEEKDASDSEREISEINSGIMAFSADVLEKYLPMLNNHNAQNEFYLTDLVSLYRQDGGVISTERVSDSAEVMGINDRVQLSVAEQVLRQRNALNLMRQGATLLDPNRVDVHGDVQVGKDVLIEANVFFRGKVVLGDGVTISANCLLDNCTIGEGSTILANSVIELAVIGKQVRIGPFARIRPNTVLHDDVRIGNFVETKAAEIGLGSKVNHLSYIGDATIGASVNIGAGTITCNYDGANKFRTTIEDDVFVGSNTALVAPITVGAKATIGAGSTITHNVGKGMLAVARAKMREIANWVRPTKK